jgi:hypothetical protein
VNERLIRASAVVGLASLVFGCYAYVYRAASLCSVPEGCDIPGTTNQHPYATFGVALFVAGCAALCLAVAIRHRTAR